MRLRNEGRGRTKKNWKNLAEKFGEVTENH